LPHSASAAFAGELAAELASDALERFLRYVRIDTQAAYGSDTYPSTEKQLDLSRLLVEELRGLGLEDVELTEHGYVFATLPGTASGAPTIGLMAHVDTTPEVRGGGVEPVVHPAYDGSPIVLPGDPAQVLDPQESPELAERVGHDLVTSDGTTLLGADDKAGVAEIMAAVAYLSRHPEPPRAPVRVAFTVDEEIGEGTRHLELEQFGADVAYTLDGARRGEVEDETFSAAKATITFRGRSAHTGTAKGVMVNAVKAAADFVTALPRDRLSPETTEGREGFVHPDEISGNVEEVTLVVILRDFDDGRLEEYAELVNRAAEEAAVGRGVIVEVDVRRQYSNMKRFIDDPRIVEAAEEAVRRAGMEPRREIIRGGTDGSRLSEKGLPCPNLSTGGHDYHSRREWICVADMGAAASTLVHLAQVWGE
jgi:tripeptide aminopeptidase